jgi:DNA-binding MarR family transcriptional regulator
MMSISTLLGSFLSVVRTMNGFEPFHDPMPVSYAGGRPALLFGAEGTARGDVAAMFGEAGVRLAAEVPIGAALERLDQQVSLGLAWVEATAADVLPDALLDRLDAIAAGGTPVVLSIPSSAIDTVVSSVQSPAAQILVDADGFERAGALSYALAQQGTDSRVSDVGRDNAVRLRQISDEMGRIAATLARLSTGPEAVEAPMIGIVAPVGDAPQLEIETVRSVIRARRLRARYFNEELFADPAWDMLLDLLQAEIAQHRVPVSSLCIAAAVPATTALRWIKTMTDSGLFRRRADPHDGRRVFVELAPDTSMAMRRYFADVGKGLAA